MRLGRGTVVLVSLDPTIGHEQRGSRPCVVVSNPLVSEDQRFPLVAVVPITARAGEGALYPLLRPGSSGLKQPSYALIDQIRTIDKRRVHRAFGVISEWEMATIDDGLKLFLDL